MSLLDTSPAVTSGSVADKPPRAKHVTDAMFVLLEHTTCDAPDVPPERHWDLIVEAPGAERLPTWRLAASPLDVPGDIAAERIPDHRPHFLHYEGPLTGDRGHVRRLDRGPAMVLRLAGEELTVAVRGRKWHGRCRILRDAHGTLVLRRYHGPSPGPAPDDNC
jgi:hypothetical protein